MFRISLVCIAALIPVLLSAQDTINRVDEHGKRQGPWKKTDTAGKVVYRGQFIDGVPVGEFRYYYPDGKLKTVSRMSESGKKASTVTYFPNGNKMAAGNYVNEKKDSTWRFFSESNGTLVSQDNYTAGVINGLSKIFYPDSTLSEQYYYKNGLKDGLWEQYYLDGKLKLRGAFKAGDKQGVFKTYYPDGKLMIDGRYEQGHQDGTWVFYNEKGVITKKEIYLRGKLVDTQLPGK